MGQYDSAAYCYTVALKTSDGREQSTYRDLITIYLATEQYAKAESVLVSGTFQIPDSYFLRYLLGVTYGFLNNATKSKPTFEMGLHQLLMQEKKEGVSALMFADEGLFYARLNERIQAINAIDRALAEDSTNDEVMIKVVATCLLVGDKKKAKSFFEKARALNVDYDLAYLKTAFDLRDVKDDPEFQQIALQ